MKLENLTNEVKEKKKAIAYVSSENNIYKDIPKEILDKKHLFLKEEFKSSLPNLYNKKLEVRKIKLSNLGNMKAWVVYFNNAENNPYLAHQFN